jgi:hypothetical protein
MNAVPGMTTTIKMVPTITTDSMRTDVMKDDVPSTSSCYATRSVVHQPLQHADALGGDRCGHAMTRSGTPSAFKKPFQALPMACSCAPAAATRPA